MSFLTISGRFRAVRGILFDSDRAARKMSATGRRSAQVKNRSLISRHFFDFAI